MSKYSLGQNVSELAGCGPHAGTYAILRTYPTTKGMS
ncbi:hypothetical protein SPRI_1826 [Streptomyces pristinaespiralis]|uniref:Uncharacterized protein n=1 Tax=Streptomyces pristinaespiralis TaxID=38300 RepID=A0A0M4DPW1_STRPR|nr:hypothetical protein SPRI_1826 [Streptomyces pristinaespiralis]